MTVAPRSKDNLSPEMKARLLADMADRDAAEGVLQEKREKLWATAREAKLEASYDSISKATGISTATLQKWVKG